ncbi:MAG: beta-N-acetylhexosaminidase [Pseudomonadota bacterium]
MESINGSPEVLNGIISAALRACTVLTLVLSVAVSASEAPFLIPAPAYSKVGEGHFELRSGARVSADNAIQASASFAWVLGLFRDPLNVALQPVDDGEPAAIQLKLTDTATLAAALREHPASAQGRVDEAYRLTVSRAGIEIHAAGSAGLQHGLVTLWQLVQASPARDGVWRLPSLEILDAPQFEWRGLMLDSARHLQSVDYILELLDRMALHKLNVFHWHLTDDQAWRLEIKAFPRLAEVGGFRVPAGQAPASDIDPETGQARRYGGYFTQEEVRAVVARARERHIMVVPEVDVPGHVPDDVPASWGIYHNVFNLEESTFRFFEQVLDEVVALFPGPFVHLGGDEVVTEQWAESERVAERMAELGLESLQDVQNVFVERLQAHLDQYERRVIGWDEILESSLPPHAAVMSWRGVDGAIEAAAKGHQTVLSPAPTLYLDHIQTSAADAPPGRGGVITVREVYEFDPLPERLLPNRQQVLGLQANLWTEHVRSEARASYMTWPRAAALAEVGWSPAEVRNFDDFVARLAHHRSRFDLLRMVYASDPEALTGVPTPPPSNPWRRENRELELCSSAISLALEDDAPLNGERASFLVDILNPCWLWRDAELATAGQVKASVGQLPFNFEIGASIKDVVTTPPQTPAGELVVHLGTCDGPVVAELALAPAVEHFATTTLPSVRLATAARDAGQADLCLRFRSDGFDPFWAIDWIELEPAP